jgi:hypothetical protein
MATQYRWKDLIDKSIFIKGDAKLYRSASDNAIPYATIKAGNPAGVLYSWVSAKVGRSVDWLMFYDKNNKVYYVPVIEGTVDLASLKAQGVKTSEERSKEEEDKNKKDAGAVSYYIEKYVPYILGAIIIVPVLKSIIDKKL